jgi:hydrogenase maturation factor HypF (carbamoyltransferase family)
MSSHSLIEKIEALPEDKKAEVEDFVDFLYAKTDAPNRAVKKRVSDELFRRINERREQLRRERGLFSDSTAIIRELRENGS